MLQLDVSSGGQPAAVTVIVPALTPQTQAEAQHTAQPAENEFVTQQGTLRFSAWLLTVLLLLCGSVLVGFAGARLAGQRWGIRWALCALGGGLLCYNYLAIGLPGSADFAVANGIGGVLLLALLSLLAGWGAGWLWRRWTGR